jgi:hypothetical protein
MPIAAAARASQRTIDLERGELALGNAVVGLDSQGAFERAPGRLFVT